MQGIWVVLTMESMLVCGGVVVVGGEFGSFLDCFGGLWLHIMVKRMLRDQCSTEPDAPGSVKSRGSVRVKVALLMVLWKRKEIGVTCSC